MTIFKLCPKQADEVMLDRGVSYALNAKVQIKNWTGHANNFYNAMTAECKIVKVKPPLDFKVDSNEVLPLAKRDAEGWNLCLKYLEANGYKILKEIDCD